jgi:uncharacterized membrane protein YczE
MYYNEHKGQGKKMKKTFTLKKTLLFIFCFFISPFAQCLALKANIGTGAYSAITKTLSPLLNLKIGTIGACMNIMCILVELLILKKDFKIRHFLQFFFAMATGALTNYFYYNLLGNFQVDNYILRVGLLVLSDVVNSFAVATLLNIDYVSTPLGGACHVVSTALKKPYAFARQGVDVICIIVILIAVFFFHGELTIREGTIINALEFGPMVDFWLNKTKGLSDK